MTSANRGVTRLILLASVLALLTACSTISEQSVPAAAVAKMETLVSAEWLSQHLNDPDLVVLDCTVLVVPGKDGSMQIVNGRANYDAGHIPSAGFADLMGDLSARDSELTFVMPTPEQFVAAMSALGVGDDSRVVLYDATNSAWAARVWWMLRWVGFDQAALLDGGQKAWTEEGRALSTEPSARSAKTLTLRLRPELIADQSEVLAVIDNGNAQLVDALPEAHYRGDFAMYARPGHISGATNVPSSSLLDESGRFRSYDELDMMIGHDRNARTITYCGGGIAASADAFVLHRLGFKNVAVYAGSLQEWVVDPNNPMQTGAGRTSINE